MLLEDDLKIDPLTNKVPILNRAHLRRIILNVSDDADLNHLDTSKLLDISYMFFYSGFNGDISKWDVSNVKFMNHTFKCSRFNGDISGWNVSNVINMAETFMHSKFSGDISQWDVSNVRIYPRIFEESSIPEEIQLIMRMKLKSVG